MVRPGFAARFRDHLGSEEFDEKIQRFLNRNAKKALQGSDIADSKTDEGPIEGEFSLEANDIWQEYLVMVEDHMKQFQEDEELTEREFKTAVEDVGEAQSMLVRLMIASWEFTQFLELCREFAQNNDEEEDEIEAK
eukprot:gene13849-29467_t